MLSMTICEFINAFNKEFEQTCDISLKRTSNAVIVYELAYDDKNYALFTVDIRIKRSMRCIKFVFEKSSIINQIHANPHTMPNKELLTTFYAAREKFSNVCVDTEIELNADDLNAVFNSTLTNINKHMTELKTVEPNDIESIEYHADKLMDLTYIHTCIRHMLKRLTLLGE